VNATAFSGRALGFLRRHIAGGGTESPELTWTDATDGPRQIKCVPDTLAVGSTVGFGGYEMQVRIRLRVTREHWLEVTGMSTVGPAPYFDDVSTDAPASGMRITFQGRSLRVAAVDISPCSSFYSLSCVDGPKERTASTVTPVNYSYSAGQLRLINSTTGNFHLVALAGASVPQFAVLATDSTWTTANYQWSGTQFSLWNYAAAEWQQVYIVGADGMELAIFPSDPIDSNARVSGGKLQLLNVTTGNYHTIFLTGSTPTLAFGPGET